MAFYQFKRQQVFTKSKEEMWDFIIDPHNLKKITPEYMGFDITTEDLGNEIYEGMVISYKVSPLLGIKMTWVTVISQVKEGQYFVDEQKIGPYKLWHHQHILEETAEGTLMTDIVSYSPPFGLLGALANKLFIRAKLNEIFDYRAKAFGSF